MLSQKDSFTRELQFVAFELVQPEVSTVLESYEFLERQGFSVIPHILTQDPAKTISDGMFNPAAYVFPTDGLIVEYNDQGVWQKSGSHRSSRKMQDRL